MHNSGFTGIDQPDTYSRRLGMAKQKQMTERGFTLIVLIIAVAIIGVLAAIAIPEYQNYVARSQVAEAFSLASGTKTAVAEHYLTTASFPDDNEAAGLATTITGKYVASVTVAGEKITAKFKPDGVNENIKDRSLVLTASDEDVAITFDCTTDLNESYAPKGCKTVGLGRAWDPKTSASEGKSACWELLSGSFNCWGAGCQPATGRWVEGESQCTDSPYCYTKGEQCFGYHRRMADKHLNYGDLNVRRQESRSANCGNPYGGPARCK